jgi:hypothetical protein
MADAGSANSNADKLRVALAHPIEIGAVAVRDPRGAANQIPGKLVGADVLDQLLCERPLPPRRLDITRAGCGRVGTLRLARNDLLSKHQGSKAIGVN